MTAPFAPERTLRLSTGLVLLAFTTSHFVNHSFGIRSVEAMTEASKWLLKPWQSGPGAVVLYTALFLHAALGLRALFRRRHLRMPAAEAWQLALGLTIPLLLVLHAGAIRVGGSVYGLEFGYGRLLYNFWVVAPDTLLVRQFVLLVIVWVHGCIGVRAWLRPKPWYPRALPLLATAATLIPALAVAGLVSAGLDLREDAQRAPAAAALYAPPRADGVGANEAVALHRVLDGLLLLYVGLVAGTLMLRTLRNWHAARYGSVRIGYPGGRVVRVPHGFSVLEASRWAGISHVSVCGGRGRCSTCRVRIVRGMQALPPPAAAEQRTLTRIAAPADVRLACQIRPNGDVTVQPLVRGSMANDTRAARFEAAIEGGREVEVAAMFVDLRESTRIATGRLPYDVLFLFDRYIQVVTTAIRDQGGHVTSVAGDGVMSVFGSDGDAAGAAAAAFRAALQLWDGLARLNEELTSELQAPLRFGVGLHVGVSVVGRISERSASLQFLGDTGNLAAKLEAQAKSLGCSVVASEDALRRAVPGLTAIATAPLTLPGREQPLAAVVFAERGELAGVIAMIDGRAQGVDGSP